MPPTDDPFDPENLRLPSEDHQPKTQVSRPKRTKRWFKKGEPFLGVPISLYWLMAVAHLPGRAETVGLAIWYLVGLAGKDTVALSQDLLTRFGVSRQAGYRALRRLECAGLVKVERRPGRLDRVTVLECPAELREVEKDDE